MTGDAAAAAEGEKQEGVHGRRDKYSSRADSCHPPLSNDLGKDGTINYAA